MATFIFKTPYLFLQALLFILYWHTLTGVLAIDTQKLLLDEVEHSPILGDPKPFWAIAHRVLDRQGVVEALRQGANALEIDVRAYKQGWWAAHDKPAWGDSVPDMFKAIVDERQQKDRQVGFVWLDIKTPDWCDPDDPKWRHCSIDALMSQAREILEPAGIRVLYGFYKASGKAFGRVCDSLSNNEALNLNGEAKEVKDGYNGLPRSKEKRTMAYGYFHLPYEFGQCNEEKYYTCTELRKGVLSSDFGKIFGWTVAKGQDSYVNRLMYEADVDGLIYGLKAVQFRDNKDTASAFHSILRNLKDHRRLARMEDIPW